MIRLLWPLAALAGAGAILGGSAALAQGNLTPQGFSGALAVPDASVLADGHAVIGYSRLRLPGFDQVDSVALGLGLFPFFEFSGRLVHGSDAGPIRINDLSASLKLRLPGSLVHAYVPDVAIGVQDLGSARPYFRSRYAVVTEQLGPLRLTAGYGLGPDRMDGFLAAAELRPVHWLRLLGDHDGDATSIGAGIDVPVEIFRTPVRLGALVWGRADGDDRALDFALSLDVALGRDRRSVLDDAGRLTSPAVFGGEPAPAIVLPEPAAPGTLEAVAQALVEAGFENVRLGVKAGRAAYVELEDNVFLGNELDGLGVALGLVATGAPRELDWIVIVQRRTGLALRELWVPRWPLVAYLEGKGGRDRLEQELDVTPCLSSTSDVVFAGGARAPSYAKARVVLEPRLQTIVGTELTPFGYVLSARPGLVATLWKGAAIDASWEIPLTWSREFDDGAPFRKQRRDVHTTHALLHQAVPIAPGLVGLVGAGLFRRNKAALLGEVAWSSPDGMFWLRAAGGHFRDRFDGVFSSGLVSGRAWIPWIDASVELTGGRYFLGDQGGSVELARFFGDTEVGAFYQRTGVQIAGVRVALPLTPRRGMHPYRVSLRGTPHYRYDHVTTVNQAANTFHPDQGILPHTDYTIRNEYQNRGRLGSDYARAHLDRMREAFTRWGRGRIEPPPLAQP